MKTSKLVTFGCSWTAGVGACYEPGMSNGEYESIHKEEGGFSFRSIISNHFGIENVNFAVKGSSNQRQFRLAEDYDFEDCIVLWGITSTSRFEVWNNEKSKYKDLFMTADPTWIKPDVLDYIRFTRERFYDHDQEVKRLESRMKHWNHYFKSIGVKNYWFDTLNHHDYRVDNMIEIGNPRDLLSRLSNCDDKTYHYSHFKMDCDRIHIAEKKGLVNPYSFHPTKKGHKIIADWFIPWLS